MEVIKKYGDKIYLPEAIKMYFDNLYYYRDIDKTHKVFDKKGIINGLTNLEFDTVPTVDISTDLGLMLYNMDYSDKNNIMPMYFRAKIQNGVLDLTDCEVLR